MSGVQAMKAYQLVRAKERTLRMHSYQKAAKERQEALEEHRKQRLLERLVAHEERVSALHAHRKRLASRGRRNNHAKQRQWLKTHSTAFGSCDPTRNSYIAGTVGGALELADAFKQADRRFNATGRGGRAGQRGVTVHKLPKQRLGATATQQPHRSSPVAEVEPPELPTPAVELVQHRQPHKTQRHHRTVPGVSALTAAPTAAAPTVARKHAAPVHGHSGRWQSRSRPSSRYSSSRPGSRASSRMLLPPVAHHPEFPGVADSTSTAAVAVASHAGASYYPPCTSVQVRSGYSADDFRGCPPRPRHGSSPISDSDYASDSDSDSASEAVGARDVPEDKPTVVRKGPPTMATATFRPVFEYGDVYSAQAPLYPVVSLPQVSPVRRRKPVGRREVSWQA